MSDSIEPSRFDDSPAMTIVGFSRHYAMHETVGIPRQWEQFMPHMGKVPGQVGTTCYGVSFNHDPSSFDYLTGVEVSGDATLPEDYTAVSVPAAHYAVFIHAEDVSRIASTFQAIFGQWLPGSGRTMAPSPILERYDEKFDEGRGSFEIWIPIQQ